MNRILLLGDTHCGKSSSMAKTVVGANINSRVDDQFNLLDFVLEQAIENGVSDIIITGDIFEDPKPHPTLLALFLLWLKKCRAQNIRVRIIMGNHDMIRAGDVFTSSLDVIREADLDNVSVYKQIDTIIIGSTAITLMPFRDRKSFSVSSNADAMELLKNSLIHELASIPITFKKILIGHFAIDGAIPVGDEIDDIVNELYCPIEMFKGYDFVWMGHIHKPQVMHKENPYIAHIGSMDISNFGEVEQHKSIIIIDTDTQSKNFITKELPTRPLKRLQITIPKDTEDTTAYVLEEMAKQSGYNNSIVRVEISLAVPELKSVNKIEIEKYLAQQGVFNITGISETKKSNLIKKDGSAALDTRMDVATAIKTYAETNIDKEAQADYIELSMEIYNQFKLEDKS
jgi:DNA repair exonuclease SbcCD nuclease subunit